MLQILTGAANHFDFSGIRRYGTEIERLEHSLLNVSWKSRSLRPGSSPSPRRYVHPDASREFGRLRSRR